MYPTRKLGVSVLSAPDSTVADPNQSQSEQGENTFPELEKLSPALREEAMPWCELLAQNWRVSPQEGHYKNPDGSEYIVIRTPDKKSQRRVNNADLWDVLQQINKRMPKIVITKEDKETAKGIKGTSATTKIGEGVAFDHRVDPNLPLINHLIQRSERYQKIVFNIGEDALMIVLQTTKIDPMEVQDKLADFEEGDKFLQWVRDRLVALLQASKAATVIQEQIDEIRILSGRLTITVGMAEGLARDKAEANKRLMVATGLMDKETLNKFTNAIIFGDTMMNAITGQPNGKAREPPTIENNFGEFT